MVYRISFRRLLILSGLFTVTLLLFWPLSSTLYSQSKYQTNQTVNFSSEAIGNHGSSDHAQPLANEKLWFFRGGTIRPVRHKKGEARIVWPHEDRNSDRIINQLMYIPHDYDSSKIKKIVIVNNWDWGPRKGNEDFKVCPVSACTVSMGVVDAKAADMVIFKEYIQDLGYRHDSKQIWMLYNLESPYHTVKVDEKMSDQVDWTGTYRMDSDVVAPYEKWVYYDESQKVDPRNRQINFAANKTGKVAWFVSNCHSANDRLQYAQELQENISVDIYGACGDLSCPRVSSCYELLNTKYKFYLSFENSNCNNYITEKFFVNGLNYNVLPIVMGAPKSDYLRSAPHNSFLHVDDFASPQHLADYLHKLDADDELYNSYFQWKGTGEFINTYFWCRVCAMLHDSGSGVSKRYPDVNDWWRNGICR